ncbi:MAG: carbohydrate ABC transporter permease [Acidimicrobiales bacterium]
MSARSPSAMLPAPVAPSLSSRARRQWRQGRLAWMLLPTLAILAFVIAYPAVRAVQLSFTSTSLINPISHGIGFQNYRTLFHDSVFYSALKNTMVFTGASVVLGGLGGLVLALMLEDFLGRFRVIQTVLLTPWAVPTVVAAFLFRYMFEESGGIVNSVLLRSHLISRAVPFLASPKWSMPSVIVGNVWVELPFFLLVFSAGLKSVPDEIVEAARTDSAGKLSIVRHVKLHYLKGPAIIATLLMVIANFNNFPHIEAMTGGGPGISTTTLVIYVYQLAFSSYNIGYASAVGVVWLVILLVLAVGFVRTVRMETT